MVRKRGKKKIEKEISKKLFNEYSYLEYERNRYCSSLAERVINRNLLYGEKI
jgi:hypothetical protein